MDSTFSWRFLRRRMVHVANMNSIGSWERLYGQAPSKGIAIQNGRVRPAVWFAGCVRPETLLNWLAYAFSPPMLSIFETLTESHTFMGIPSKRELLVIVSFIHSYLFTSAVLRFSFFFFFMLELSRMLGSLMGLMVPFMLYTAVSLFIYLWNSNSWNSRKT